MQSKTSSKQLLKNEVKIYIETEGRGSTVYQVKKSDLATQMSEAQKDSIQDSYHIPIKCASYDVFLIFEKYLTTKKIELYNERIKETEFLIGTLRFADFIGMNIFQEQFISKIITPAINTSNCVPFLEQTHKKLKNQENGSQCWYSLLNASITFLAFNLSDVYIKSQEKLKNLHEKILNEILDRAIRNGHKQDQIIFQLILKSRKTDSVHQLCEILRKAIINKKINPKIHAKLSWKLQDVENLKDKKTKNFKFLDYQWLLQATKSANNDLNVNLTYCGIKDKIQIGAFYIKLIWWKEGTGEQKKQQQIRINYILMNKRYELKVLTLTEPMQKELGKIKIQLSIFCCMDQIYTFTLNYITKNNHSLNLEERQLTAEQLEIIASLFKERKQYAYSIRYIKYLATMTSQLPESLISNFPLSQLGAFQLDFIQRITSHKKISSLQGSSHINPSSQISEINSVTSQSRKSEQRPQSRGRLRKIFASSPNKSVVQPTIVKIQDINRITNIKNYFYDKNHPFYSQI